MVELDSQGDVTATMRPIIDAHLDIAWNALSYDRDQLLELDRIREVESGMTGISRGNCTVSLPEMRRANVRVCLGTLLCRSFPEDLPELDANLGEIGDRSHGQVILREDLDFANQTIACAAAPRGSWLTTASWSNKGTFG